jgi:3-isopropylmalate/(R)-2-methylmalate dehydratase large subunit
MAKPGTKPTTLYDKIWSDHLVDEAPDGTCLIYIDRHLVHEVTSPQAFEGLRLSGRKVHAPDKTLCVVDHNVPTTDRRLKNPDPESEQQIAYLAENAKHFGLEYFDEFDRRQGIVHIIGPEQGFTLPGTTLVCGDSHTGTHGAFGALAYGIGTSEVEHVLATQTLIQKKSKNMRAVVDGKLPEGVTAKDIILAIIGEIGTAGGTGYALEYAGDAITALTTEGRMTVCNMSVEAGAKAGFIAPDEKVYAYLKDRPKSPKGAAWDAARRYWDTLRSDDGAKFDRELRLDAARLPPLVTWGTSPEQVVSVTGRVPVPDELTDENKRIAAKASLAYMGLSGGERITDIAINRVFIGSCTNGRIEDLRAAARVVEGKTVNGHVNAMIVPGSGLVKEQAEAEGLDRIFRAAGFEWRELLHVPRDESRQAPARRALRLDLEPQFRGAAGLQGPHASRVARNGGRGRDRRTLRRRARLALTQRAELSRAHRST